MTECHDIIYGPFCVNEVVNYVNLDPDNCCDDIVIKKIFIDAYNRTLAFDLFRTKGIKQHKNWIFPKRCMQNNSYDYALFWYCFKMRGGWIDSKAAPNDKSQYVPDSFLKH